MAKIRRLFGRKEIPQEARELLRHADGVSDLLVGLDELITKNEIEVNRVCEQMSSLEALEQEQAGLIREGALADRSKNNALRRIQRLRKQMDNLEERQCIYNRNINLQIDLVGRVQALDAMEMRGVNEDQIDQILCDYEEELGQYQSLTELDQLQPMEFAGALSDKGELQALEAELFGPEKELAQAPAAEEANKEVTPAKIRVSESSSNITQLQSDAHTKNQSKIVRRAKTESSIEKVASSVEPTLTKPSDGEVSAS